MKINQIKDIAKYVSTYCTKQHEELHEEVQKYRELCELTNAIADLSNNKIASALDYIIKEIAYLSVESNYEVRKRYLSEVVKDLTSGMDNVDVVLKYKDILDRYRGIKEPKSKHLGRSIEIIIIDDLFGDQYE